MKIERKEIKLKEHTLVFRSPEKKDASMLIEYLKRICAESEFISKYPDEVKLTISQEEAFINKYNEDENSSLILAELDGIYVGNASFNQVSGSRRNEHRAIIGIGLYDEYTSMGIGKLLFKYVLELIKSRGFEIAELKVVDGNTKAINMYKSFGFKETGRIIKGNKYDDGTYRDHIIMSKDLSE